MYIRRGSIRTIHLPPVNIETGFGPLYSVVPVDTKGKELFQGSQPLGRKFLLLAALRWDVQMYKQHLYQESAIKRQVVQLNHKLTTTRQQCNYNNIMNVSLL